MRNGRIYAVLTVFATIFLLACTPDDYRSDSQFCDIDVDGWAYGDTLVFSPSKDSLAVEKSVSVALRHSASYKYGNVWLELRVQSPDTLIVDTANIKLFDRYGRALGNGTGVSFLKIDTLSGKYSIAPDTKIGVRHLMRVDTLAGIEQIGLIFIDK